MVPGLSARMWEGALCASACPAIRATPTQAAYRESATRTQTVDLSELARITSVWTRVACPVGRGRSAPCRTMWLSAGALEGLQGTLSGTAEDLPGMRSALLVGPTRTVRLARMTVLSVGANPHISGTPCKAVAMSVTLTVSAGSHRPVTGSTTAVRMRVAGEPAGRMQTARL